MCGTGITMSLLFRQILGPLILCWAPDHFLLGAQLAPGEKRLVRFPDLKKIMNGTGHNSVFSTWPPMEIFAEAEADIMPNIASNSESDPWIILVFQDLGGYIAR